MKGGTRPLGYTIVEVMIVLAVSGLMFILAANFINGRQARNSFQQGVNELASRIQGVVSDVTDGHFSDIPMTCTVGASGLDIIQAATPNQGSNPSCVFMGKMLHFKQDETAYEVFSLAGAREKADGSPVVDLSDAEPTVISFLTAPGTTPQSLLIRSMKVTDGSGAVDNDKWTIGFVQSLGGADTGGGDINYASGAQTTQMVYVHNISAQPMPLPSYSSVTNNVRSAQGAVLCVTDGTRYARISIGTAGGANNSQVDVRTKIVATEPECTA